MEFPNEKITFETPDGIETVELEEGDSLLFDAKKGIWKIPHHSFDEEKSVEYRIIPEHRVYEVKRTESPPEHLV